MSMFPGLPPLTADDHEFKTTWDLLEKRDEISPERNDNYWYVSCTIPPDGLGWTMVGFSTATEDDEGIGCCLWARRKDGLPVACSDDHALRMSAATLAAMAKTRDELVTLSRAAIKATSPTELQRAISDLNDWIEDYDATRGTR